ncbi:MAG: 1,4-dihydroxy-2-naphthoate octaprenyltransferase [Dehalococcoidia bacterium]|jgi:1,4-dihydroxy-2-naphthoate octaprenyltransferase
MEDRSKSDLLQQAKAALSGLQQIVVSTVAGDSVRSRLMPFAFGDDLTVYLAFAKADPAALLLSVNPAVSLLAVGDPSTGEATELEITGKALLSDRPAERQKARDTLAGRRAGNPPSEDLRYVRVVPQRLEMRSRAEPAGAPSAIVLEFSENRRIVSDWALLRKKAFAWLLAVRLPFITASVTPVVLGGTIAWANRGTLSWGLLWLTIAAGALIHLGVNVINDYFDHLSANDDLNTDFVRPFSGGSRVIQMGLLTPLEMLVGAFVLFGLSSAIGIYLAVAAGVWVLAFGAAGLVSGIFYVGNPINWGSRGVGELLVGLNFGILMTLGSYYVQTGRIDWAPAIAAIPVGALIAAVLYVNEFPDYAADMAVGKKTWVVRLGRQHAAWVYSLLMAAPYVAVVIAVAAGVLPLQSLLAFLTLPLAVRAVRVANRYYSQPLKLAPANALTIVIHLATGLLLTLGYVWDRSGLSGIGYLIGLALLFALILAFVTRGIEQEKQAFLAARQALSAGQG